MLNCLTFFCGGQIMVSAILGGAMVPLAPLNPRLQVVSLNLLQSKHKACIAPDYYIKFHLLYPAG